MDFRRSSLLGWLELPVTAPKTSPQRPRGWPIRWRLDIAKPGSTRVGEGSPSKKAKVAGKLIRPVFLRRVA